MEDYSMKKLIGLAAAAGVGYLAYNEYNRRKQSGDEFVLKLDSQIHELIDGVGSHIDSILANIEAKLDKAEQEIQEAVE